MRIGRGLFMFLWSSGTRPGHQVGGARTGWRIPPLELARVRRELGLPRLPQHQCTCGTCAPFSETGCEGHLIDLQDRRLACRQRIERATGATYYGR